MATCITILQRLDMIKTLSIKQEVLSYGAATISKASFLQEGATPDEALKTRLDISLRRSKEEIKGGNKVVWCQGDNLFAANTLSHLERLVAKNTKRTS